MEKKRNRFVGMASFTEKEHDIFFGRDQDIEKLATLIQTEKLVVLFSKSGVGKSSLLKAGIEPYLMQKDYVPIRVRFFNYAQSQENYVSPSQVLENIDGDWQEGSFLDELIPPQFRNSVWARLKLFQINNPQKVLLILMDQFEELFTHPAEEVMWFKFQLSDMLQTKLPKIIEKYIDEKQTLTEAQIKLLYAPIPLRVVLSLRSDYLSFLQQFRDTVPFLLNKTYELAALTTQTAKEALLKPTEKEGDNFTTTKFSITQPALEKILNELSGTGKQIESFQLQTVGSEIEKIIINKRKENPYYQHVEVEDLPDLQNLWAKFYDKTIMLLPAEYQGEARKLIEEHLVQQGRRISLDEIICKQILPDAASLKILVDNRLLRIEPNNTQGFSYEVSHDTLIKPIIEKLEKKQAQRKEEELQAKLREAEIKAEKESVEVAKKTQEARQNRRLFHFAMVAFFLACIAVAVSFYLYWWAKRERDIAVESRVKEYKSRIIAIKSRDKAEKKEREAEKSADEAEKSAAKAQLKEMEAQASEKRALASEQEAHQNAQRTKEALEELKKNQAISKAKELTSYGQTYEDLGKKDFACESYRAALKLLMNYPQIPEYYAIQQKINEICGSTP